MLSRPSVAIYSLSIPIYIIPLAFFCYYPLRIQSQWKVQTFGREQKKQNFFGRKRIFFWCWKNYTDKAMCPSSPQSLWFHRPYFLSPLFWSLSLDGDYHDVQTTLVEIDGIATTVFSLFSSSNYKPNTFGYKYISSHFKNGI